MYDFVYNEIYISYLVIRTLEHVFYIVSNTIECNCQSRNLKLYADYNILQRSYNYKVKFHSV